MSPFHVTFVTLVSSENKLMTLSRMLSLRSFIMIGNNMGSLCYSTCHISNTWSCPIGKNCLCSWAQKLKNHFARFPHPLFILWANIPLSTLSNASDILYQHCCYPPCHLELCHSALAAGPQDLSTLRKDLKSCQHCARTSRPANTAQGPQVRFKLRKDLKQCQHCART